MDDSNHIQVLNDIGEIDRVVKNSSVTRDTEHRSALYHGDLIYIDIGRRLMDFSGVWKDRHGCVIRRITTSHVKPGTSLNVTLKVKHLWKKDGRSRVMYSAREIQILD